MGYFQLIFAQCIVLCSNCHRKLHWAPPIEPGVISLNQQAIEDRETKYARIKALVLLGWGSQRISTRLRIPRQTVISALDKIIKQLVRYVTLSGYSIEEIRDVANVESGYHNSLTALLPA